MADIKREEFEDLKNTVNENKVKTDIIVEDLSGEVKKFTSLVRDLNVEMKSFLVMLESHKVLIDNLFRMNNTAENKKLREQIERHYVSDRRMKIENMALIATSAGVAILSLLIAARVI